MMLGRDRPLRTMHVEQKDLGQVLITMAMYPTVVIFGATRNERTDPYDYAVYFECDADMLKPVQVAIENSGVRYFKLEDLW